MMHKLVRAGLCRGQQTLRLAEGPGAEGGIRGPEETKLGLVCLEKRGKMKGKKKRKGKRKKKNKIKGKKKKGKEMPY